MNDDVVEWLVSFPFALNVFPSQNNGPAFPGFAKAQRGTLDDDMSKSRLLGCYIGRGVDQDGLNRVKRRVIKSEGESGGLKCNFPFHFFRDDQTAQAFPVLFGNHIASVVDEFGSGSIGQPGTEMRPLDQAGQK